MMGSQPWVRSIHHSSHNMKPPIRSAANLLVKQHVRHLSTPVVGRIPSRAKVFAGLTPKVQQLVSSWQCLLRLPLQWGDQDVFGHLNNVHYAKFLESGRIAHAEQVLRPHVGDAKFKDFVSGSGIGPIVKSISITYKAPTYFPDELIIATRIKEGSIKSDRFVQECIIVSHVQERIVATAESHVVVFDYSKGSKADIPSSWIKAIHSESV